MQGRMMNRLLCLNRSTKNHPKQTMMYIMCFREEEVGRGAKTAGYNINPDLAIAVDVTATGDTPDGIKWMLS